MAELSDSFKQLDTVGKLRYKEKLAIGMLGVTTDPYSTSRDVWYGGPVGRALERCAQDTKAVKLRAVSPKP